MSNTFPPDEYLTSDEVDTLHGVLSEQLNGLLKQSKEALHDLTDVRAADADALDLAVSESNRDFSLRLADRERRLMSKIRHALARIQEGEYGVCESCGAAITYKRLLARPVATLCIDCKTEAEQLERRKQVF
ncbi:MAG: RNA polymerase-binding protein DksA [Myxococcales bacterium]|nr:RNA polymerase-binding protein DksA [Myxococcales bacterium]MCB9668822.1 RNA polymerase-binding protein DksA [Alphaproteobacteria bacterium]MCB9691379.1 RNA polymerase-binding protein DksA [Alphaproteobacteria bacterium]